MSHCPGRTLEDYLTDLHRIIVQDADVGSSIRRIYSGQTVATNEQFKQLVALYEPCREEIERKLRDFDEDESGSWRDYKYFVMVDYHSEVNEDEAFQLITSWNAPITGMLGSVENKNGT